MPTENDPRPDDELTFNYEHQAPFTMLGDEFEDRCLAALDHFEDAEGVFDPLDLMLFCAETLVTLALWHYEQVHLEERQPHPNTPLTLVNLSKRLAEQNSRAVASGKQPIPTAYLHLHVFDGIAKRQPTCESSLAFIRALETQQMLYALVGQAAADGIRVPSGMSETDAKALQVAAGPGTREQVRAGLWEVLGGTPGEIDAGFLGSGPDPQAPASPSRPRRRQDLN